MYKSHLLRDKHDFQSWLNSIALHDLIDVNHPANADIWPGSYPCISVVALSDDDINWVVDFTVIYPEDFNV